MRLQALPLLVLVAAINAVVSLYYYLLILRQAYLAEPVTADSIVIDPLVRVTALAGVVLVLVLGTFPGRFWAMATKAAGELLG